MYIKKQGFRVALKQRITVVMSFIAAALLVGGAMMMPQTAKANTASWPVAAPAAICGNTSLLEGPATAPQGAIVVPAGDNAEFNFNQPGATFWFESGTHTLGTDQYSQIIARDGTSYIGAPGAVLDGQRLNNYAFTSEASDVTVKYLTIKNFVSPLDQGVVNHDSGTGWTIEYNTVMNNEGAGVFVGTDNVIRYNCLKDNGQYGFSVYNPAIEGDRAVKNIVLDHNEITGNNTGDWEKLRPGCGCTGGGKFWDVQGAQVTNNWVHHNKGTGLWADTNNIDFLFENNYVEQNDGVGIWYEISYNATIRNNVIARNAWVSGNGDRGAPGAAIYLSESGGDSRLASRVSGSPTVRIYDNLLDNNYSGVSIYENANRFCNSISNTSTGYCTPNITPTLIPGPYNHEYPAPSNDTHPCYTQISEEPYRTDCRWHAKNIEVNNNEFRFDNTIVPCASVYCGVQALYVDGEDTIPWAPYTVREVQDNVRFNNNNRFHDNTYIGNWKFTTSAGQAISFANWQAAPYSQDTGSTHEGETTQPITSPNDLDADTSTLEGSLGQWQPWYSSKVTRSNEEKHTGSNSLRVEVTDPWGWGVQLANWPGVNTTATTKTLSFWGKVGTGTNIRPKMEVKWLGSDHNVLRTDSITLPALTTSWQNVTKLVDAPAGSATALVSLLDTAGKPGDVIFLDDMVVGDAPNLVEANTANFESGIGNWQSWYSVNVARDTTQAQRGTSSMKISVTDPWGWAAQLGNWPGFEATAGNKRVSYWAKQGTGSIANVQLHIKWLDGDQTLLRTDTLPLTLSQDWQKATANISAPISTASFLLDITSGSGKPDDVLYVDNIEVLDN